MTAANAEAVALAASVSSVLSITATYTSGTPIATAITATSLVSATITFRGPPDIVVVAVAYTRFLQAVSYTRAVSGNQASPREIEAVAYTRSVSGSVYTRDIEAVSYA